MITLYILAGCVGAAAILFIVMIVLSVARPPKLPNLSLNPPPLEKIMRALTPLPFATPTPTPPFDLAPTAVPPPPPPRAPRTLPPPPPPPPAAMPSPPAVRHPVDPAAMPSPPAVRHPVDPAAPTFVTVDLAARPIRLPRYPTRRGRKLVRILVGTSLTTLLAAGAVTAYPAMLDPLCDDYEWFGTDAAAVVRQHARDAHAAIADFIDAL